MSGAGDGAAATGGGTAGPDKPTRPEAAAEGSTRGERPAEPPSPRAERAPEPGAAEPGAAEPGAAEPGRPEQAGGKPAAKRPAAKKPVAKKAAAKKAAAEKPAAEKPAAEKPAAEKPAAKKPASKRKPTPAHDSVPGSADAVEPAVSERPADRPAASRGAADRPAAAAEPADRPAAAAEPADRPAAARPGAAQRDRSEGRAAAAGQGRITAARADSVDDLVESPALPVPDVVGIIGAGPSGLVTAATLRAAGLDVEVLERHTDVGGIWDIDNPGSPMYSSAHFISSKTLSALDGYPFPAEYPDYPSRPQVLAYLRGFADDRGLRPYIRFGDAVRRADRLPGGGWRVTFRSGRRRSYRALVLASGLLWEPNRPSYPGTFSAESFHAKYYRGPEQLRGKRVLVVGGGNSGVDIACDAAVHARSAAISLRRGYHFVPKHIFGRPADVFAHGGPRLPARVEQAGFGILLRLLVGDLRRYGLRKPDHRILSSHPIMNTQLLHYLAHGDIHARPDVSELDGSKVRFVDDTAEEFDQVIYATGYRLVLPYLDDDHFTWHGPRPQMFLNTFHPGYPDLFAVGLFETDGGAYPLMSMQARLVAQHLQDQRERPDQATAFRKLAASDVVLHGGVRYLPTQRHALYLHNQAYLRYCRKLLRRMERGRLKAG
jgi:hypothetical protein